MCNVSVTKEFTIKFLLLTMGKHSDLNYIYIVLVKRSLDCNRCLEIRGRISKVEVEDPTGFR